MKVFSVAAALLLAGALSSCQKDWLSPQDADGLVLHLAVSGQTAVVTKATRPGEDLYNENTIGNVADFFFFQNADEDAALQHNVRAEVQTGGDVTIPISKKEMQKIFGNLGSGNSCSVLVVTNYDGTYPTGENLTRADILDQVLETANWLNLPQGKFVMINPNATLVLQDASDPHPLRNGTEDPTINLERVAVKLTFEISVTDSVTEGSDTWTPVPGGITAYLVNAMRKADLSGEPMLLPPDPKSAEGKAQLYTYDGRRMRALTTSSGDPVLNPDANNRPLYAVVRGTTEGEVFTPVRDQNTGEMVQEPFYAYPSRWDTGSMAEPYIKLVIPWNTGKRTKQFYYKIPFAQRELTRNTWYKVVIDVQALGGEEDYAPTLDAKYYVAPWLGGVNTGDTPDASTLPTSIIAARYLSVPTKEYILYNLDELTIPINSSHDLEIVGFQVGATGIYTDAHKDARTNYVGDDPRIYNPFAAFSEGNSGTVYAVRPDYSTATPKAYSPATTMTVVGKDYASDDWNIKIVSKKEIKFKHALNRDMSRKGYDVTPYTIRFRIRHADAKTQYYEDVTIEQRPPVMIVPESNTGSNSNYGYAWVNGSNAGNNNTGNSTTRNEYWTSTANYTSTLSTIYSSWTYFLGTAPQGTSNSSNTNTSMYIIEASVLPTSGNLGTYMLADPRSLSVNNLNPSGMGATDDATWSHSEYSVLSSSTKRKLQKYYPAIQESYASNFIAPKFRVASSYGATQKLYYEHAARRCASYQEDGYPAGRWRLPTAAEIVFIAQLNSDGVMPRLLGSSSLVDSNNNPTPYSDYWCNYGFMRIYNGTASDYSTGIIPKPDLNPEAYNATDTKSVRCVYDDWYWGDSAKAKVSSNGGFRWGDQDRSTVTMKED